MANLYLKHEKAAEVLAKVAQDFEAIIRALEKNDVITKAATVALDLILKRTQAGKGVDGSEFIPYSAMWAAVREAAGLQTDHVDLTFSGTMTEGFAFEVHTPRTATLFVGGEHADAAEGHQTGDGPPQRQFFGLSPENLETLQAVIRRELVRLMLENAPNTIRGDLSDEQILGEDYAAVA